GAGVPLGKLAGIEWPVIDRSKLPSAAVCSVSSQRAELDDRYLLRYRRHFCFVHPRVALAATSPALCQHGIRCVADPDANRKGCEFPNLWILVRCCSAFR